MFGAAVFIYLFVCLFVWSSCVYLFICLFICLFVCCLLHCYMGIRQNLLLSLFVIYLCVQVSETGAQVLVGAYQH